jgi:hypothetical protein
VILSSGQAAFIFGVLRGQAVVTLDRGCLLGGPFGGGGPMRWGVVPASQVRLVRHESARILGGLKKGIKEEPSDKKRLTCIQNGCRRVAEGEH